MAAKTSDGAHELALTIINDGAGYDVRRRLAGRALDHLNALDQRVAASDWVFVARGGARAYERQFGSPGASCFTVADILGAALELAEYYEKALARLRMRRKKYMRAYRKRLTTKQGA